MADEAKAKPPSGSADREWSDPERVAEYLGREIPHRTLAEELLLEALPARVGRVLDLGTGDGRLLGLVVDQHPGAQGVGLDVSEPMLARARERLSGQGEIKWQVHDLAQPLAEEAPFDAIVSGLAIHHLEDGRKRELFAEVHDLLTPGGTFANLDLVRSATPVLHRHFRERIGRAEDDPSDRLADLVAQMDWLCAAGFDPVDCRFKWLELTLLVGTRL